MDARVRFACEGDVAAVVSIERGSATAPHWTEEEYRRIVRGDGPVRRCLVVVEKEQVVGFAAGSVVAGVGELENIAVRADRRGQGFGKALCEAVLAWCRKEGAEAVELEVREGSVGARHLYERLGFVAVGRRRKYYSQPDEDGVLYQIGFGVGPSL